MREKLLLLHQNLIYPAFLGVLLVNFTQVLLDIPLSKYLQIDWLWLLLGAWFMFYFCAAYIVLLQARKEDFGFWAFFANLAEVIVVLFAATTITKADPFNLNNTIEFWKIFACWLAIPITAAASNGFSERWIKTILSLAAVIVAGLGLYWWYFYTLSRGFDVNITILMVIVLILYFLALAAKQPWICDFSPREGFWTFAKRREAKVQVANDAAGRARQAARDAVAAAEEASRALDAARAAASEARSEAESVASL